MYDLQRKVLRVNIKTTVETGHTVEELRRYCLKDRPEKQCLPIGWSCVYENSDGTLKDDKDIPSNYEEYRSAVKEYENNDKYAVKVFGDVEENDLFWTRDEDAIYWICRATGKAQANKEIYNHDLDIGIIVPVKAYKVGKEVPGQINASFNMRFAGILKFIDRESDVILEFSKHVYNEVSGEPFYKVNKIQCDDFLNNLPPFELEELVISYLQIEKDLYLRSNSIAFGSTTAKIECEFMPRKVGGQKAVVQVKGPKHDGLRASEFKEFADLGYVVYLYCPAYEFDLDDDYKDKIVRIEKDVLQAFVDEKGDLLPENIMKFRNLFSWF